MRNMQATLRRIRAFLIPGIVSLAFWPFCAQSASNPEPAIAEPAAAWNTELRRLPPVDAPLANLDTPHVAPAAKPDALQSPTPVRLGIPYFAFADSESLLVADTVAWLTGQFGNQLTVEAYDEAALREAIERGSIDLFIASAGLYREFAEEGSKDLASLTDDRKPNPNASAAAVVIVRNERQDLQKLADLHDQRISAASEDFFTGWQPLLWELKSSGCNLEKFFRSTVFTGMPMSQIVERVARGIDDAGVLSACYFETLQAAGYPGLDAIRILEPKENAEKEEFACRRSTRLFPGLTIATMPSANPSTMRAVTRELFSMPPSGAEHARWSVATNFSEIDAALKSMALGPYRHLSRWTVNRLWEEYWHVAVLLLILAAGGFIHTLRTESVVRTRTAQLRSALAAQQKMQAEASEKSARIELLEREGVVQQLSSMLAHELRQPMTSIGFFTKGLISRIKRGNYDPQAALTVLEKIRDLNQQSNAIVDHVRGYAKERVVRERTDVSAAVQTAVKNLIAARFHEKPVAVRTEIEKDIELVADKFELELIVNNLVKNAIQACVGTANPEVVVSVRAWRKDHSATGIVLTVADNGPAISPEALQRIGRPFDTTKKDGLGLGTSIVRRIAESYGGRLSFRANQPHGLVAEVLLLNPVSRS